MFGAFVWLKAIVIAIAAIAAESMSYPPNWGISCDDDS